jgi:NADH:ubiquinone oxidoreductase subunit F (NADH-binding)
VTATTLDPGDTNAGETTAPVGLPRLLRDTATALDDHIAQHGPLPRSAAGVLIDEVDAAGLRGRGGASFPTATKLRAVAAGRRAVVVANGCEGEPASTKDALLLTRAPHLVLDGLALAAMAVRARQAIVATERVRGDVMDALARAISERAARGIDPVPVRLVGVPPRYLAGEESALVHFLDDGEAKPTNVPPRPFERGVHGRPTLVQNVETLAQIALIARHGAEWFRTLGTESEPGSALFTVSGGVATPGVYEAAFNTRVTALLDAAGGTPAPLSAVLVGGYFGAWVAASRLDGVRLGNESLRDVGAALGCGVVVAMPASVCGLREAARVTRYLAEESAGQCGPCVHGLAAVAAAMDALARGRHDRHTTHLLGRWTGQIAGRGACRHPDGAVRFVRSALEVFADEIAWHEQGRCSATETTRLLPVPSSAVRDGQWR